ncbi:DNA binding protein [Crepidotus variabilis]|uniref:DNA binding protein n=1 Tax=Crepidotus variabilis TaxID=179855 RepID=A0A9P6JMI0_9AGAR|nr:DNA binding protein [Crepidotus variabilis]
MNHEMGSSSTKPEPMPIKKLSENVINKIAAGEIIQRPASALKELIENCLDAAATSIRVTVKDGGLKLLQIQDNGSGIRKADLPILAERFTTSKLSTFSDLSKISTYGFRGEALASMSHVAHLTVITKTKADGCAWKASYSDGALVDSKTGQKVDPRPCAGNDGTTITIEDLFYNTPTRLAAIRSPSEEYARILDVVTKYAIHNPHVAFLCKKSGSSSPELSTPSSSNIANAIKLLYGNSVAKELLDCDVHSGPAGRGQKSAGGQDRLDDEAMDIDEDEDAQASFDKPRSWMAKAYFTNPNYQAKKFVFLLFINHRLVESARMKRAMEAAYQTIMPKGASPFMYLSLQIDPRAVDVNVHPTKREVHFLNEEDITDQIADAVQEKLAEKGQSRAYEYHQTTLTGSLTGEGASTAKKRTRLEREQDDENLIVADDSASDDVKKAPSSSTPALDSTKRKIYSHHKVRTSTQDRTLDSMFPISSHAPSKLRSGTSLEADSNTSASNTPTSKTKDIKESECFLTSVKNLRKAVLKGKHRQFTEIIEKHTFVGIVDQHKCLSLIQYSTKLYLVNHDALAEELFYQLGLRQFGDLSHIKLDPPPPLRTLLEIAVGAEESTTESKLSKEQIVDRIEKILLDRREMLSEYFSLAISDEGNIESIPLLLQNYLPNLDRLPEFLMRLGPQVDWGSEMECFDTFLREVAYFYTPIPSLKSSVSKTTSVQIASSEQVEPEEGELWQIQHALFPAMRRYLVAPKSLLDNDVLQIADLPELYKVFERC